MKKDAMIITKFLEVFVCGQGHKDSKLCGLFYREKSFVDITYQEIKEVTRFGRRKSKMVQ